MFDLTGVDWIESLPHVGLSKDPAIIHQGNNSGYQAIDLVSPIHFPNTKRAILIGYDMQRTHDKTHWFGDHPNKVVPQFNELLTRFDQVATDARQMGYEIINSTIHTALNAFPKMPLEEVLNMS